MTGSYDREHRFVRSFVFLLTAMLCLTWVAGGLAEPVAVFEYDEAKGLSDVYISGLNGSTEYAVILLDGNANTSGSSGGNVTAEQILYLDQVCSTSYGSLHLTFIQMGIEGGKLALGGPVSGEASPYVLGTVNGMSGKMTSPAGLAEIGEEAFSGSAFEYVYIGNSVQRIRSKAFAACTQLRAIHIPDSVTSIADDAFEGSGNVVIICGQNSEALAFALRMHIPYILN